MQNKINCKCTSGSRFCTNLAAWSSSRIALSSDFRRTIDDLLDSIKIPGTCRLRIGIPIAAGVSRDRRRLASAVCGFNVLTAPLIWTEASVVTHWSRELQIYCTHQWACHYYIRTLKSKDTKLYKQGSEYRWFALARWFNIKFKTDENFQLTVRFRRLLTFRQHKCSAKVQWLNKLSA